MFTSRFNTLDSAACSNFEVSICHYFFYSLVELSKSRILPSLFPPAFTRVIGHFAANFRQVGCLLPWPDPCCCCNGDSISTSSAGGSSTLWPHSFLWRERAALSTDRRKKKGDMTSAMTSFMFSYTPGHYRDHLFIAWNLLFIYLCIKVWDDICIEWGWNAS